MLFEKESVNLEDIEKLIDRIIEVKESLSALNKIIVALQPSKPKFNVLGTLLEK
jgi:GTP:adenosylcobinamide-phosphate guanylyltransferase